MTGSPTQAWFWRADVLQDSLEQLYGAPWAQLLHNQSPRALTDDGIFNYWWLAHVLDCRVDAYERSKSVTRLEQAKSVRRNVIERNEGSLFNDYFDDMLWFGLALLRLRDVSGDERYGAEARLIWDHVVANGWNDECGRSLAWMREKLWYKNTPANGPLAILGARLYERYGREDYGEIGRTAFEWIHSTLRREDGFVEDGINRLQDGAIDTGWRFSYNQGLYIGAAVELSRVGVVAASVLEDASQTAHVALDRLRCGPVIADERPADEMESVAGDVGLFKGIFYRYLTLLLESTGGSLEGRARLVDFIRSSTDVLWDGLDPADSDGLRVADDWSRRPVRQTSYSTQVSALMAVEARWIAEDRAW